MCVHTCRRGGREGEREKVTRYQLLLLGMEFTDRVLSCLACVRSWVPSSAGAGTGVVIHLALGLIPGTTKNWVS